MKRFCKNLYTYLNNRQPLNKGVHPNLIFLILQWREIIGINFRGSSHFFLFLCSEDFSKISFEKIHQF